MVKPLRLTGAHRGELISSYHQYSSEIATPGERVKLTCAGFYLQRITELPCVHEVDPSVASQLVGERHDRFVLTASRGELSKPTAQRVIFTACSAQSGAGSVDEKRTKLFVATLGDSQTYLFGARGVFLRHQADEGRQMAAILEVSRIDLCDQRTGGVNSDAWATHQISTGRLCLGQDLDPSTCLAE